MRIEYSKTAYGVLWNILKNYLFRESILISTEIQNHELNLFLTYFCQRTDFDLGLFMTVYKDTDEKTVIKILAHFKENLKDCADILIAASQNKDIDLTTKAIHKIAGSSELLGFKLYADRSRDLIKKLRSVLVYDHHISDIEAYLSYTQELSCSISLNFKTLDSFL